MQLKREFLHYFVNFECLHLEFLHFSRIEISQNNLNFHSKIVVDVGLKSINCLNSSNDQYSEN